MKASRLKIAAEPTWVREPKPHKDLTGMKFGRLTVIKPKGMDGYNHMIWECACDCGNPKHSFCSEYSLMNGKAKSCGCLNVDFCKQNFSKRNTYDLSGEYGIGYTQEGVEFYFDLEDFDKIKDMYWYVSSYGYMQTRDTENGIQFMHRVILGISKNPDYDEIEVDHIHAENIRDNRKCNLRLATHSQNGMNKPLQRNNKTGVTGVSWDKARNKWRVQIQKNGVHYNLGSFNNFDDAVAVRKEAEERLFKDRSYSNSQAKVF